jgi:hypothetical protein
MVAMRFDYRDIFRAPRIAFSFQRMWIQFLGLLAGWVGYSILTYLAFLAAGENLAVVWSRFGLLPCAVGIPMPWYSKLLLVLGILILVYVWLITATAVARAVYMHLKGNNFYTWKEAVRFALKKKGGAVGATPLAILVIIFFTGLGGVIVGLLGRIPYIGELGISLFTILWYAASLFLVFLGLALAVSLLLAPSVLAATDDDAFEGIFQSFSTLASQPWRLILYGLLIKVLSVVGLVVLAFFAKQAWIVMNRVLILGMGDKFADLSYAASYLVQNWVYPAVQWVQVLPANVTSHCFFSQEFVATELPVMMTISATITAIFLVFIGMTILSYPLAIFNSGTCILFLILKKKKDDENLLERKDKEEETGEEEEEKGETPEPSGENKKVKRPSRSRKPAVKPRARTSRRRASRKK